MLRTYRMRNRPELLVALSLHLVMAQGPRAVPRGDCRRADRLNGVEEPLGRPVFGLDDGRGREQARRSGSVLLDGFCATPGRPNLFDGQLAVGLLVTCACSLLALHPRPAAYLASPAPSQIESVSKLLPGTVSRCRRRPIVEMCKTVHSKLSALP